MSGMSAPTAMSGMNGATATSGTSGNTIVCGTDGITYTMNELTAAQRSKSKFQWVKMTEY